MKAAETALARFDQGYSCSQAVFSALAERFGVERDLALRIAAGFGGGLARTGQVCGCVTGAVMALGLAQKSVEPGRNRADKEQTYEAGRGFMREFALRNGSTVCCELLGCDIGTPRGLEQARREGLFQSRCAKLVRDAVESVEAILERP